MLIVLNGRGEVEAARLGDYADGVNRVIFKNPRGADVLFRMDKLWRIIAEREGWVKVCPHCYEML